MIKGAVMVFLFEATVVDSEKIHFPKSNQLTSDDSLFSLP